MKLVVDGDILLFRSCAAVEREAVFDRIHVLYSDFEDAKNVLEEMVQDLATQANTDDVIFAFSDGQNWRRNVFKDYKANRKGNRKPLVYGELKEYCEAHYECLQFKGIEADDIMGIYANREGYAIWSLDKDLKQCPGQHLVDDEIVTVTERDGDRFHWYQTLIGDVTDNYSGCPGVGPKAAEGFLSEPFVFVQETQTLKSGKNKGDERTIWVKKPTDDIWAGIVSHYEKVGLTEQDALTQARVAYILRDGDYDFEKERVKLWKPKPVR